MRVATTAAGTLATSFENGDTVDGVVLATGDRILIKDQAAGAENGIYIVNGTGAPTRATDTDVSAEVLGTTVLVMEGTTNGDKLFYCTTNAPITLDTTALVFAQISGGSGDVSTDAIWDAKGDLAVGTGANTASRLAVGTDGQIPYADSTAATGIAWGDPPAGGGSGGGGALEFVAEATVSGSAATTLTLSGLDLDADEAYFVSVELDNATAGASNVSLYYNADTTATNYDNQVGVHFGASTVAARANNAVLFGLTASAPMSFTGWLRRNVDGNPRLLGQIARYATTSLDVMVAAHAWRTASTNVTSITLSASVASSLAVGSKIRVWKIVTTPGSGSLSNVTPDTHPASPNAMDDEFEAASLAAKWTWRNQGTATAAFSKGALRLKGAATNHSPVTRGMQIIEQTISGDFKAQAKLSGKIATIYNNGGFALIESGTGKLTRFGFIYESASKVFVEAYTNVTTYSAQPYITSSLAGTNPWGCPKWLYFEIERSGSTLYYRVSETGEDDSWVTVYSVAQTTHFTTAPDRIGLYVESISATQAVLICDWFRRVS